MGKIWATIDRFEEDKAVLILPDKQQLILAIKDLPPGLKEGDILVVVFAVDKKELIRQKAKIKKKLKSII